MSATEAAPSSAAGLFASVYVERITVRAFRGISECEVELEPDLTVLAGHNNAGKSRVLSALQLALGGRAADVDDFTVGSALDPQIDLVLAPTPPTGNQAEHLLERAGFVVESVQGGYHGEAFTSDSSVLLLVGRRRD